MMRAFASLPVLSEANRGSEINKAVWRRAKKRRIPVANTKISERERHSLYLHAQENLSDMRALQGCHRPERQLLLHSGVRPHVTFMNRDSCSFGFQGEKEHNSPTSVHSYPGKE
jgi:hypothetical protein